MGEFYRFVSDPETAKICALVFLGLTGLGLSSFVYQNAKQAHLRLTEIQWVEVYGGGGVAALCGILVLGYVIVPDNADNLVDLLFLGKPFRWYWKLVQQFMQWFVRLLM